MSEEQEEKPQEPEPAPKPEEPVQEKPEEPVQEKPAPPPVEEAPEKPDRSPEKGQEDQSEKEKQDEPSRETQGESPEEKKGDEQPKEDAERPADETTQDDADAHDKPAEDEAHEDTPRPAETPKEQRQTELTISSEGLDTLLDDITPPASGTQDFILPTDFLKESAKPKAKTALGSAIDIRRSIGIEGFDKKMARYANTYRLESNNPFNVESVEKILKATMDEAIANMSYEPEKCLRIAKWASGVIRGKVKEHEFDRFKIITIVTIGEKNFQDMMVACRSLWDGEKDRYSYYSTENDKVYAFAMCFGIYYE